MTPFPKTVATLVGAVMLATTPFSTNAAVFKPLPSVSLQESMVSKVHRRRYRHTHRRRYDRRRHNRSRRRSGAAAGIIGGIILGGIIAESRRNRYRRTRNRDRSHINWCYNRYRSYRAYDNTYQPYNGRRRPCFSPYY